MTRSKKCLHRRFSNVVRLASLATLVSISNACSFIELNPAAQHIIFAHQDECKVVDFMQAEVRTEIMFIGRTAKAIAEELQILAQNAAYEANANAIWPSSEVIDGKQSFALLQCQSN